MTTEDKITPQQRPTVDGVAAVLAGDVAQRVLATARQLWLRQLWPSVAPTHCGECGGSFQPLDRVIGCPDCPRAFCASPGDSCLAEHRKLGTCPDHADGVLAEPQS